MFRRDLKNWQSGEKRIVKKPKKLTSQELLDFWWMLNSCWICLDYWKKASWETEPVFLSQSGLASVSSSLKSSVASQWALAFFVVGCYPLHSLWTPAIQKMKWIEIDTDIPLMCIKHILNYHIFLVFFPITFKNSDPQEERLGGQGP